MQEVTLESVLEQALQLPASVQEQLLMQLLVKCPNAPFAAKTKGKSVPLTFTPKDRSQELQWLDLHRQEYAGQWVALEGNQLVANDEDAKVVFAACDEAGIADPYFVHIESADALPFAGW